MDVFSGFIQFPNALLCRLCLKEAEGRTLGCPIRSPIWLCINQSHNGAAAVLGDRPVHHRTEIIEK